jgi:hypothetical protein
MKDLSIIRSIFILTFIFLGFQSYSQIDSLVFGNGNKIYGNIKGMDRGVLTMETDYSDSDFKIEWEKIKEIYTHKLLISLENGEKFIGNLYYDGEYQAVIQMNEGLELPVNISEIVFLNDVKDKFADRFSASIDLGFNLTKANNLQQLSSRANLGYETPKFNITTSLNVIRSTQDNVDEIERDEINLSLYYLFPKKLFAVYSSTFLSSTELQIQARINNQLGLGYFLIKNNQAFWSAKLGANRNLESFEVDSLDRNSWESFLATELNLFDIGDLSFRTKITMYNGLTRTDRIRLDGTADIKYDLPLDFYIKGGFTINYDNQPAEGASDSDYVLQTGFGWEW